MCDLTLCTKVCLKKSCHILKKLEDSRRIFEEYSNTKFHLNQFGRIRVVASGEVRGIHQDKTKLMVTFRN